MTVAIDPDETFEYSLTRDAKQEDKAVFILGVVDGPLRVFLDDEYARYDLGGSEYKLTKIELGKKFSEFVRFGLKGWRNFNDKRGAPVEFKSAEASVPGVGKRVAVTEECLKRLDARAIVELGVEISAHSRVSEADEKSFQ